VDVDTQDHGDGRYSATYKLDAPRDDGDEAPHTYTVSMTMADEHIQGSPYTHNI
jgi:hypothetical protein